MRCVIGGTFNYFHEGHRRLFSSCRKFSKITVGLTSNSYVRKHKIYPPFPYEKRLLNLKAALQKMKLLRRAEIVKIENEIGPAVKREFDTIVVGEEKLAVAEKINLLRKKNGTAPLKIISVPLVFSENLKKISCADIYERKIDLKGKLRKPIFIQAGTENPTKLRGASEALKLIFGRKFKMSSKSEKSNVSCQPFGRETFVGAKNRAVAAWKRADGSCDYSIGIESGIFQLYKNIWLDITVCCVYDGRRETYGTSLGFAVPDSVVEKIKKEKSDLEKALHEMSGVEKIGRKEGAFGYFSDGKMHRSWQVETAVASAFVPRIAEAKKGVKY